MPNMSESRLIKDYPEAPTSNQTEKPSTADYIFYSVQFQNLNSQSTPKLLCINLFYNQYGHIMWSKFGAVRSRRKFKLYKHESRYFSTYDNIHTLVCIELHTTYWPKNRISWISHQTFQIFLFQTTFPYQPTSIANLIHYSTHHKSGNPTHRLKRKYWRDLIK